MASLIDIGGNDNQESNSVIHLDVKTISSELSKIPKWLKWFLVCTIFFGIVYFKVFEDVDAREMKSIQQEVTTLKYKVNGFVTIHDYLKDYRKMQNQMQALIILNKSLYEMHCEQTDMILDLMESNNFKDQNMFIKRMQDNMNYYEKLRSIYDKEMSPQYVPSVVEKNDTIR